MNDTPHACASDLPGWPCPPRVRDIPNQKDSHGWVWLSTSSVVQDDLGRLWGDGDAVPKATIPVGALGARALLTWTAEGLGVYIAPKDYYMLLSKSVLDMTQDRWLPIAVALAELPEEDHSQ